METVHVPQQQTWQEECGMDHLFNIDLYRSIVVKTKKPELTAKGLKESFEQVDISVHASTIHKSLNRYGGDRTPCSKPKNQSLQDQCVRYSGN